MGKVKMLGAVAGDIIGSVYEFYNRSLRILSYFVTIADSRMIL